MKKLVIAACAASLFSGAALAGPGPQHANKHGKHADRSHSQPYPLHHAEKRHKRDFHRNLFNFALFLGTAFAIDAALDNHHDRHDKPAKPHRPHNRPNARPHDRPHAHAHNSHGNINKRQERQAKRIRQGIRSGELVHKEAKKLRRQQRKIADLEADFRHDGRFSKKERAIIQERLDTASQRIYRLKHNDRYRS